MRATRQCRSGSGYNSTPSARCAAKGAGAFCRHDGAHILPLREGLRSEVGVDLVLRRRQHAAEATPPTPPPNQPALAFTFDCVPTSSPACAAKIHPTFPPATPQLRGKATVRVPLTWIPYFMRKESDAERSMGGLHGRTALIQVAVVLLVGAAALLGLSYRVRQRRAARARLGLV